MQTTASNIRLTFDEKNKPELTLSLNLTRSEAMSKVHELKQPIEKGKKLSVEVKPHRNKRSPDANSFCWILCDKIAQVIGSTKEEVYRKVIRDVGVFEFIVIHPEATETFIDDWSSKGIGWFAEVDDPITINQIEFNKVVIYKGSSRYDTKEMSRLIDELVNQAKELNIETRPQEEIDSLLKNWEGK